MPDPCINGQCTDKVNGYECICTAGYTGNNCDSNINDCLPDPCINGQCTDKVNGYECICTDGYYGKNCEHKESIQVCFTLLNINTLPVRKITSINVYSLRFKQVGIYTWFKLKPKPKKKSNFRFDWL